MPEIIISLFITKIACIVAEIETDVIYWGYFMKNKVERYQKAVNIVEIMEQSSFAQIMQKGLAIHELNQKFNRTFPQEFQGLFRIGQINGDTIFIEVANAIVRQGMLFRQLDLLTLIQKDYPQIKKLDLKISPEFNRAMP